MNSNTTGSPQLPSLTLAGHSTSLGHRGGYPEAAQYDSRLQPQNGLSSKPVCSTHHLDDPGPSCASEPSPDRDNAPAEAS